MTNSKPISLDELIHQRVVGAVRHQDLFEWLKQKMTEQRYYEYLKQIFVHAGIDEEVGEYWEHRTIDDIFTGEFSATTDEYYKDIVNGDIQCPK